MTTIGRPAAGVAWAGDSAVLVAVIVALVPMGILHVVGSTVVDPITDPISHYVQVPGGYTLIAVTSVTLAVAGLVLAGGIDAAGLPGFRTVSGLLVLWSGGLVVVAAFPTNLPGTPIDAVGTLHRVGGAVVFAVPPLVGGLVAVRARLTTHWQGIPRGFERCAGASGVLTTVFFVVQVPVGFGGEPIGPVLGLMQRVLFAVGAALLVVVARSTHASSEAVALMSAYRHRALTPTAGCGGET